MPIGMFFWMCDEAIKMQSPEAIIVQLVWFFGLTICALMSVWLLIIPGLYFLVVRKNPYIFMMNIMPALVVAFGSSSSAITLPVTMDCMIGKNQLAKPVGQFVLPLGMTIHMPGPAMYYPMVTLFVAQMHGLQITWHMFITVFIFAVIMSMAFPAAPSGGSSIVNFIAFCAIIGIDNPLDVLAYTISIDWLMERLRTVTNVMADAYLSAIIEKLCNIKTVDDNNTDHTMKDNTIDNTTGANQPLMVTIDMVSFKQ
ncbi:excitatory amino acid transporter 5-like [Oppia nitens]|uniref:excitatory amino acid transporter 5-like n=1 Tax=Oppia nitens TaxID=1686743 RepID=UPI0023DA2F47|nr:excitatory amino acid transporter 5-like [Oppia nitens]